MKSMDRRKLAVLRCVGAFVALVSLASSAHAEDAPEWGVWTFVQSDKAVQYRVAKVGQKDDVAELRYQLRIEPESDVSCNSDSCQGHIVHLPVFDPAAVSIVATHHLFFPKGSSGTYDLPEVIHFPVRTSDTGRRFIDPDTGLPMYEIFDNPGRLKVTEVLQGCVDDVVSDISETRCSEFDQSQMVKVGG